MDAKIQNINDIFKNSTVLRIPFFQRQYVWKEEQWERFADDMEAIDDEKDYFLGALIFKEEKRIEEDAKNKISKKYTVIDGQQRLTTLSIYLKALLSKYKDDYEQNDFDTNFYIRNGKQRIPVLHHSVNDYKAYQAVMLDPDNLDCYNDKKVVEAYYFFRDKLNDKNQELLGKIYTNIKNNVKFVEITLNEHDDEQQIFDTINSLGVDLTIDELMKNFLYDSTHETAYRKNWEPLFDENKNRKFWQESDAKSRQAKSDKNKVITNFFYYFVRIKMWDFKDEKGFNKNSFVQKSQIFSTCKAFKELFETDKQDLANEIIEYAKLYKEYFDKKLLDNRIRKESGIDRVACIAMAKDTTIIPYLLYVLKNVDSVDEKNKIFDFLENYLVRRMVSLSSDDNKMSTELFAEQLIAKRIDTYEHLKNHILGIDSTKSMHFPTDQEIADKIHNNEFKSESIPRLIYYLLETKLEYRGTGGYNYFIAEYIMPIQSEESDKNYPPCEDKEDEMKRQKNINTLGNFILLGRPSISETNSQEKLARMDSELKSATNKKPQEKVNVLKNYIKTVRCSNWFSNFTNWTEENIKNRNSMFAQLISKQWAYPK